MAALNQLKQFCGPRLVRQRSVLPWVLVPGALAALPIFVDRPFILNLFILLFIYAALAQAWNVLAGYAGQISLGQYAFFGIGAYSSTLLWMHFGVSPWVGLVVAILLAIPVAVVIGYPTFRLATHYFTIATLLVLSICQVLFLNWDWAGGAAGIYITFRGESFWAFQFQSRTPYYYISLALAVICTFAVFWLERSRLGYYFRAIKSDPDAAQMVGVNVMGYKLVALILHACMTAAVGVVFAQYVLFIDPVSLFDTTKTTLTMLAAVIGGIGTVLGPVLGVLIMIPLSELTRLYLSGSGVPIDLVLVGAVAIWLGILQPRGLIRSAETLWRRFPGRKQ